MKNETLINSVVVPIVECVVLRGVCGVAYLGRCWSGDASELKVYDLILDGLAFKGVFEEKFPLGAY